MCIKVKRIYGKISVEAPYNADFVQRARMIRGRWDPNNKVWTFPAECADVVRETLRAVYGEDGSECKRVNVRVTVTDDLSEGESMVFCGWNLCRRFGRDSAVKMADGVALISGGFPSSGGSAKYPRCYPDPGTVVMIYGVPLPKAEEMAAAGAEIVEPAAQPAEEPAPEPAPEPAAGAEDENRRKIAEIVDTLPPEKLQFLANIVEAWARKEGYFK